MNTESLIRSGTSFLRLENYLRMIELSGESCILTDPTGSITYASPGIEKTTGYSWEELLSRNARIFSMGQTTKALYESMWTTILDGRMWSGVLVNKKKDGQCYLERLTILPVVNAQGELVQFCAKKERVSQNGSQSHAENGHSEPRRITPHELLYFISRVVEEIRSSMNATKGFVDLLVEDCLDGMDLVKKDYVSIIRHSHQRMLNTIDDVLTIARLDVGDVPLHLEPVPIAAEIRRIISRLSVFADRHRMRIIKVIEDKGALVSIDRSGFEQIITNLFSNALKFTRDGGYLTFGVNVENSQALITVNDTGIGISEEFKSRVFQPFSQEEIGNRSEYEGAGLGLAITKRLTELMGGSITFDSRKNNGTSFVLRFPVVGWAKDFVASDTGE